MSNLWYFTIILRSAYNTSLTREEISNWPDVPAVILFDQFSTTTKLQKIQLKTKQHSTQRERVCVWCVQAHAPLDREGRMVFASKALVIVQTTVYLASYTWTQSDCLMVSVNHFHQLTLVITYRFYTGLKNVQCESVITVKMIKPLPTPHVLI